VRQAKKLKLHFVLLGSCYTIICHLTWLKYYKLTLGGPHKLVKKFGTLSEYANCGKSSTEKKRIEILFYILHCKKRLAVFPSSVGTSLTNLSLDRNNKIIPGHEEVG
jgi:hypothetical protein